MDILQDTLEPTNKTFLSHVFSSSEEGKAEILNVVQYALMGVLPIVLLNKTIQQFVPDADTEKSTMEISIEVLIQIIVMFCGIVIIHRMITYFPTYSGFKYDAFSLTSVILAFLILILSIQTKIGIKVNILIDRLGELWNGVNEKPVMRKEIHSPHHASRADFLDDSHMQQDVFPPAPVATNKPQEPVQQQESFEYMGPMAANGVLGGSFGASF
jgi:hypothetical protein